MTRQGKEMHPTSIRNKTALDELSRFAEVRLPKDAEEPILAPSVRMAVFEWLAEIRAEPELKAVGMKPRSTALLYGPPGTGKTTLAHHVAARLGLPLVAVQAESLVESTLGGTPKKVAALFDALAKVEGACVVLIDEIDAIGSTRSTDDQACAREMNMALTTLLQKIESFRGMAIAATNRQEALDPALWRRFGLQVSVDIPGSDERFAILKRYAAPFDLPDDDIDLLADLTNGASPALLRQLMEGMKRALVLNSRINREIGDPRGVFAAIVASIHPPPEAGLPLLWSDRDALDQIKSLTWPPKRHEAAA